MSLNLVKAILILNAKKSGGSKNPKMKGWTKEARLAAAAKRKRKSAVAKKLKVGSYAHTKSLMDKAIKSLNPAAKAARQAEMDKAGKVGVRYRNTPEGKSAKAKVKTKSENLRTLSDSELKNKRNDLLAVFDKMQKQHGPKAWSSKEWGKLAKVDDKVAKEITRRRKDNPVSSPTKPFKFATASEMSGGPASKAKHVHSILKAIAGDNGSNLKSDAKLPANAKLLESQAKKLSKGEKEIFAAGEHSEQQAILKKHKVKELHKFLNEAFDGKYTPHIFGE